MLVKGQYSLCIHRKQRKQWKLSHVLQKIYPFNCKISNQQKTERRYICPDSLYGNIGLEVRSKVLKQLKTEEKYHRVALP